jgi:peptidoglycan hydrolase-like protein with peptidoglycan-binding domain
MRIRYVLAIGTLLASLPALAATGDNASSQSGQQSGQQAGSMSSSKATSSKASSPEIMQAQKCLIQKGYNPGKADGIYGPHTASAVKKFQKDSGQAVNGQLDQSTLAALGVGGGATSQAGTAGQQGGQQQSGSSY